MAICYSYLKASTGLSLDARQAGYRAKMTLIPTPKAKAPTNTSGVNSGVTLKPFLRMLLKPRSLATTFAKTQPKSMPARRRLSRLSLIRQENGQDGSAFHSQRFQNADFACALNQRDNHDVHYADACNQQRDGCDAAEEQLNGAEDG